MSSQKQVRAQAPGKVNLVLHVGPLAADGYHPLVTVFQAVNLYETVTVEQLPPESGIVLTVSGPGAGQVPLDQTNLAHRAATALAGRLGTSPDVALHLEKGVPVAGGMAGGSADAAATLVACNKLWGASLTREELLEIGAELGSDVPFSILGGTALGTGRGHLLTPISTQGEYHWAFAIQSEGLRTPTVFRKFDQLQVIPSVEEPHSGVSKASGISGSEAPSAYSRTNNVFWAVEQGCNASRPSKPPAKALSEALASGDPSALAKLLINDLQPAALTLRPELADTIQVAENAGALAAIVSGSGPTVAALASSASQAQAIAEAWQVNQVADSTIVTTAPANGAAIS